MNDNYAFLSLSLSPARKRLAEVSGDTSGNMGVYAIASHGAQLASFQPPGQLLGWDGEETLVFATWATAGITGVDLATGSQSAVSVPPWVERDPNGPTAKALAPDGSAAAFLVWTQDPSFAPNTTFAIVMDTKTGELLDQWPIPVGQPFQIYWAADGKIVFYPIGSNRILIGERGAPALFEPPPLPFDVCEVTGWTTASTLHMTKHVLAGDIGHCEESWIVSTDGSNATQRSAPAPEAISPDGRKILVLSSSGASVAEPDGSQEFPIPGWPAVVHDVAW